MDGIISKSRLYRKIRPSSPSTTVRMVVRG
ncbi:hypothetical protein AZE42_08989 [Rhizopogon vesiculosus]|uniref:Uncharacterized protein n=1 Tax=Rhizopogon vesiculosus TaxID=180088 RepID=A0A1J8Q7T3_9AGAM|nr:hypothetical protein AZE42_08989 [Rhizopogon vesiculosus]